MPYIKVYKGCQDNCQGFCSCPDGVVWGRKWVARLPRPRKPKKEQISCVNGCTGYCRCGFRV